MAKSGTYYDAYSLDLSHKLDFWLRRAGRWRNIHWAAGTLSIAFSAISAAAFLPEPWQKIISVSATISVGFIGFANPELRAARYVRAYVILDPALRDYRTGLMDARTLTQVHRQAEETLHGTGQNPTPSPFVPPIPDPTPPELKASSNDTTPSSSTGSTVEA